MPASAGENLGGVSGALAPSADGCYVFQGWPTEVTLSPLANTAVKLKTEDFRLGHSVAETVMVFVTRLADKPLAYGSVGMGSLYHLTLESVRASTGVKLEHVPYKRKARLLQDIGGGQLGVQRSELLRNVTLMMRGDAPDHGRTSTLTHHRQADQPAAAVSRS